jgi:hypothetical protein
LCSQPIVVAVLTQFPRERQSNQILKNEFPAERRRKPNFCPISKGERLRTVAAHPLCGCQGRPVSHPCETAHRAAARRHPSNFWSDCPGAAARNPHDPDCVHWCFRPVGMGLVQSLPRPGGNISGLLLLEASITGKWLATLREIAPRLTRMALVGNPKTMPYDYYLRAAEVLAPRWWRCRRRDRPGLSCATRRRRYPPWMWAC